MLRLLHGDCLKVLPTLPDNSIDSIITDPPYGLSAARNSGKKSKGGFMGKKWDYDVPAVAIWQECLRVLKPGGHLLCFASTRTQHRMAINIEDAGFEVRDLISWIYGSGFPKNHNIEKAIGKLSPTVNAAKNFSGWGTALKPAMELITLARKPFQGTVAANVLEHGTGGINIDGCRVSYTNEADKASATPQGACTAKVGALAGGTQNERTRSNFERPEQKGRFPANVLLQHHEDCKYDGTKEVKNKGGVPQTSVTKNRTVYAQIKERTGFTHYFDPETGTETVESWNCVDDCPIKEMDEQAGASRFFYCSKASKKDRTENKTIENKHPTVKPTKLMQYLCRLVTPVNGVVLDPFAGSGTTGKAARLEGFNFIGIELEEEYYKTAQRRLGLESV